MDSKTSAQAQMLANRLQKRFRHLKKWAERTGVDAFRLYDKDIPEIPLVLDFYGDCSLPPDASNADWAVSGALYKRPYEKDEADEELWLSAMKESIAGALGVCVDYVFLKQRQRQRGDSQYEKMSETRFEKIVSDGEQPADYQLVGKPHTSKPLVRKLSFKVNLSDYLDTGLFADRRLLRRLIFAESSGKKVLNLFSYTGSFSVYAAAGGAVSTDSVDLSNTYLSRARDNFSLNGFSAVLSGFSHKDTETRRTSGLSKNFREDAEAQSCDLTSNRSPHKLIRADVIEFLEGAVSEKRRWDIIVLDPPAFSNSKKMTDNFDLNRDLTGMVCQCLKLLTPDGKIFLSVNLRRSAPDAAELEAELQAFFAAKFPAQSRGSCVYPAGAASNVRVTDLGDRIVDEDFRGRKTPKAFEIKFDTCSLS